MIKQKKSHTLQKVRTVSEALFELHLRFHPINFLRVLICHVTSHSLEWTWLQAHSLLLPQYFDALWTHALALKLGLPLARTIGKKEFYSKDFFLNKATLEPRPETELIVDVCLKYIALHQKKALHVIDLGAGSGCVGLSILANSMSIDHLTLVEKSSQAMQAVRINARWHGLSHKCSFLNQCMWDYDGSQADYICANPPYIDEKDMLGLPENVLQNDPTMALDGGQGGLTFYQKIFKYYKPFLKENAYLILEIGRGQERAVYEYAQQEKFSITESIKDLQGITRTLVFRSLAL